MGVHGGVNDYPIDGEHKQAFIAWLLTPKSERNPETMNELAEVLGVTRRTLTNWKVDKDFMEAWEREYLRTIGNPERKQTIMDTLFGTASDRDDPKHVQAAKTYMEIEGSLRPAKTEITVSTGNASSLTLEQLDAEIARRAEQEREKRLRVVGDDD